LFALFVIGFKLAKTDGFILTRIYLKREMHASWRLREQQRKQTAADEARRRAVEVSEISFPSLAGSAAVAAGWGVAPLAPAVSAAADKWTSGAASVASYVTPTPTDTTTNAATTKRGGGGGAAGAGIHARISAEVRRTAAAAAEYRQYDDDYDDAPAPADDGWIEVSSRSAKKTAAPPKARTAAPDYDEDFGSEEYGENR
jgi:hypothetical protein